MRKVQIVLNIITLIAVVLFTGYKLVDHPNLTVFLTLFFLLTLSVSILHQTRELRRSASVKRYLKSIWPETLLLVLIFLTGFNYYVWVLIIWLRQALITIRLVMDYDWAKRNWDKLEENPAKLVAISFGVIISLGTMFLTFPAATVTGKSAGFITALFTATSATCVTGLIVVDTPTFFSLFGQVTILVLIQIGGLSIMTLTVAMFTFVRKRLRLRQQVFMQDVLDSAELEGLRGSLKRIVVITVLFEGTGALLLTLFFLHQFPFLKSLYLGLFHAISAFNNAGFSLFTDNIMAYKGHLGINFVITTLIIFGGLGFPVITTLINFRTFKRGFIKRMDIHSKLAILVTLILIFAGTVVFFFFEHSASIKGMTLSEKLLSSYFQSVSARTAGFNSVDIGLCGPVTLLFYSFLMFVGASPGGTGGGIKTTTFAILFLSVRARLKGKDRVEIFNRTVSADNINKADTITFLSFSFVIIILTLLLITEDKPFLKLLFEVNSAFGTVGLSTGITPDLTVWGKLLITLLMYVGRVGPLTLAVAISEKPDRSAVRYPEGRILVG